jgi:Protein of unknown function (DUF2442)
MPTISGIADQSSAVVPPIICTHPDDVAEVRVESGYRLSVRFFDGTSGIVDMSGLINSPQAGVFAVLADPQCFAKAAIELGAVTWPNGLDLAPDAMYTALRNGPIWKLE